jgi:hypothetical protein
MDRTANFCRKGWEELPQKCEERVATWTLDDLGLTVECAGSLLQRMAGLAMAGFAKSPAGGPEIGGVLFGSRAQKLLRIFDFRLLACEHAFGPSFELSLRDEDALTKLLNAPPEVEGGAVVAAGWFASEYWDLYLSKPSLDLYDRFFTEPWQVGIVLHRRMSQPVRAGLYVRDPGGGSARLAGEVTVDLNPPPPVDLEAVRNLSEPRPPLVETFVRQSSHALHPLEGAPEQPSLTKQRSLWAGLDLKWGTATDIELPELPTPAPELPLPVTGNASPQQPLADASNAGATRPDAFRVLWAGIQKRSGMMLATADESTELNLLLELGDALKAASIEFAVLLDPPATRDELYRMIVEDLNLHCKSSSRVERMNALKELAMQQAQRNSTTVLIVDHAQSLSVDVLLEIQRLDEWTEETGRLLQTVLLATPEFEHNMERPELRGFLRRLQVRCVLGRDEGETAATAR